MFLGGNHPRFDGKAMPHLAPLGFIIPWTYTPSVNFIELIVFYSYHKNHLILEFLGLEPYSNPTLSTHVHGG
jgi:hypothetical protein